MMERRIFLATLVNLLAVPLTAHPQPAGTMPSIGILFQSSPTSDMMGLEPPHPYLRGFLRGLVELGWIEERNIVVHRRSAEGNLARLPDLARELVRRDARAIVVTTVRTIEAARGATDTIPIVWVTARDPVGRGFAKSLARPGGNVTGLTMDTGLELRVKRLELLKDISPNLRRVAMLSQFAPRSDQGELWRSRMRSAMQSLDLTTVLAEVADSRDFGPIFASILAARVDALWVDEASPNLVHLDEIIEFAARHRLPAVYGFSGAAKRGGLIEYATDLYDLFRRGAEYVDKILKGARPGELPIEQPTKFDLVINLKTAKALGLTIPPSVLARADEIIE